MTQCRLDTLCPSEGVTEFIPTAAGGVLTSGEIAFDSPIAFERSMAPNDCCSAEKDSRHRVDPSVTFSLKKCTTILVRFPSTSFVCYLCLGAKVAMIATLPNGESCHPWMIWNASSASVARHICTQLPNDRA